MLAALGEIGTQDKPWLLGTPSLLEEATQPRPAEPAVGWGGATALAFVKGELCDCCPQCAGAGQRFLPGKSGSSDASKPKILETDNRKCPRWLERQRVSLVVVITNSSNKPHPLAERALSYLSEMEISLAFAVPTRS